MNSPLDVLLVNPGNKMEIYQNLGSSLTAVEPPLWCGLIATFMRNRGFSVKILDAEAENLTPEETGETVIKNKPLLTALVVFGHQPSASTQNMTAAGKVCSEIKKKAPFLSTILIGGHVSALPERTIKEEKVDYVCEGEGPYTVLGLVKYLKNPEKYSLEEIPGLWYQNGVSMKSNSSATIINDLDKDLPNIAWDLLPMDRYRAHNWHCFDNVNDRKPYASIYTSLGCPYKCSFCCINAPFGKPSIRYRSLKKVIAEVDYLIKKYGVRNLKIIDEMFVLNEKHVMEICDLIIERGYDLNIWAYARVDTVKERMLSKLKKAGFNWLALGIESGSKHVRDGALKKFGQEDIKKTVGAIRSADINVIGNFIFGLPDDDFQTMQDTLDLAIDLNCEFANFYSAMAYPGSPLYTLAIKEGLPLPLTWQGYSQHSYEALPLPTRHVSSEEVLRFRDNAFQTYFNNPKYLNYVLKRFGKETEEHIRSMANHKLERKYISNHLSRDSSGSKDNAKNYLYDGEIIHDHQNPTLFERKNAINQERKQIGFEESGEKEPILKNPIH